MALGCLTWQGQTVYDHCVPRWLIDTVSVFVVDVRDGRTPACKWQTSCHGPAGQRAPRLVRLECCSQPGGLLPPPIMHTSGQPQACLRIAFGYMPHTLALNGMKTCHDSSRYARACNPMSPSNAGNDSNTAQPQPTRLRDRWTKVYSSGQHSTAAMQQAVQTEHPPTQVVRSTPIHASIHTPGPGAPLHTLHRG